MSWKVTDQEQTVSRIGSSAKTVDVVRVTYQTDTGFVGHIDVPTSTYNASDGPATVREAINAAVAQHEAVKSLTSE